MHDDIPSRALLRKFAALAGGLCGASGAAILAAWWTGRQDVLALLPGWLPVMANSALLFIFCGLALALLAPEEPRRSAVTTAHALALATVLLALATAAEYLFKADLGIDQLLVRASRLPSGSIPGRPAPHTAASFLLIGAALLSLDGRPGARRPAPALAGAAGVIAVVAILGHLFHSGAGPATTAVMPHNEMALLTALLMLILSAGCMATRPESGAMEIVTSSRAGGIAARRMLLMLAAMVPVVTLLAIGARLRWSSAWTAAAAIAFLGLFEALTSVLRTARHLNRLDEEQEHVKRLRAEVIAMTSHELRNPLTMTLVSVSQLEAEAERLTDQGREVLAILDRSVKRMSRLVEDFLDVEKLESGGAPLRLEKLQIGPLLAETIAGMAGAEGRVILKTAGGLLVLGDRDRLTQVLVNLISNALKFSPAGARVEVEATTLDSKVRVSVRDHGPGIPEEFRSRIFQRYARAAKTKASGSGLGLYISRMIVEKHGGRMGFENIPGDGTAFYFELPASGV